MLPSLLTPVVRHGRSYRSCRHKRSSAPTIIYGHHPGGKARARRRRRLPLPLLLLMLLRLLPIVRLWAGVENLPGAMRILGKLRVACVLAGLATVFVRLDVRLCHRHLQPIRNGRASGQCDSPRPSSGIFRPDKPQRKHHVRGRLRGDKRSLLKRVFVIFKSQSRAIKITRKACAHENVCHGHMKSLLKFACHPTKG